MSVQMNTYVMYGLLLPYDKFGDIWDSFEEYHDSAFEGIQHTEGLCMLSDGMCGKYVAVGRVLAKTQNHEGFDAPVDLLAHPFMEGTENLLEQIRDMLHPTAGLPADAQLRHLVISHYR